MTNDFLRSRPLKGIKEVKATSFASAVILTALKVINIGYAKTGFE